MKSFWYGFALCYILAGIASANNVSEIEEATPAGVVWAGVMWMPFNLLPQPIARAMVPDWAFDFKKGEDELTRI